MCIGRDGENETFTFEGVCYKNTKEEVFWGEITIDNKLNVDSHIGKMCKKIPKRMIFNAMLKSQFSYCPLIFMCSSRQSNNLTNKVHERSLKFTTNDENSSFETLLQNNENYYSPPKKSTNSNN